MLDLVGLGEAAGHRVGGFSPGMAQRLGIATALGRPAAVGSLAAWPSLWLLYACTAVVLALTAAVLHRRDA
ncbi:hypothetical protein [Actinomadura rugatobispora]|uniref:hypothetical protein n=1 Tax=Actinomadura rugatobispora TaxID=1994 RepID=UPI00366FCA08